MKKATPRSLAVLSFCATWLVGYQVAIQRWPVMVGGGRLGVFGLLGALYLSMNLMEDAPPRALFPSKLNSRGRNVLNIGNFLAGLAGASSLLYLSGLFGRLQVGSILFWSALAVLIASVLIQLVFALVTARSDAVGADADAK